MGTDNTAVSVPSSSVGTNVQVDAAQGNAPAPITSVINDDRVDAASENNQPISNTTPTSLLQTNSVATGPYIDNEEYSGVPVAAREITYSDIVGMNDNEYDDYLQNPYDIRDAVTLDSNNMQQADNRSLLSRLRRNQADRNQANASLVNQDPPMLSPRVVRTLDSSNPSILRPRGSILTPRASMVTTI